MANPFVGTESTRFAPGRFKTLRSPLTAKIGDQWIKDHAKIAEWAGKPASALMEAYGLKIGDTVVSDATARKTCLRAG